MPCSVCSGKECGQIRIDPDKSANNETRSTSVLQKVHLTEFPFGPPTTICNNDAADFAWRAGSVIALDYLANGLFKHYLTPIGDESPKSQLYEMP